MPELNSDQSDEIQGVVLGGGVIRQVLAHQDQPEEADRDVDEENHAPVEIGDDQSAEQRSEHRTDEPRNRDEAHGADQLGFRERAHQGEPAHGQHHGAAAALQDAARDQHVDVGREAAKKEPSVNTPMADANTRRVP